jgi:hypothetical protein
MAKPDAEIIRNNGTEVSVNPEVKDFSSNFKVTQSAEVTQIDLAAPIVPHVKAPVISGSGATVTLTVAQSGSAVLFDRAAGIVFTLPAPSVGLYYDFLVNTTVTSNAHKVITDTGTTLLTGSLINIDTDSSNAVAAWTGNGSSHVAVSMNGTTTGGLKGTWMRFTCISSTLWMVTGIDQGTGTVATPFATS